MKGYPVWMNHARKVRATDAPAPDSGMTGWAHNNSGQSVSPKTGYADNYAESDWRGHSLDAPHIMPAGCMESWRSFVCPLQQWVYRDE
jgi:hypothetical protein